MASVIPHELLISSTYQNKTLFFPPDYNLSDQFSGGSAVPQPASREEINSAMWNSGNFFTGEDFSVPYFGGFGGSVDGIPSSENIEFCDGGVVPKFPAEYLNNNINNNNGVINIPVGAQNLMNYGLECNYNNGSLLLDQFGEPFPTEFNNPICFVEEQNNNNNSNNWGIMQSSTQMINGIEEPNIMKVGRYSEEERKERIIRYLKKRNQRNFNKTIKYACRKTLADRRVRVRGRFARNNEQCDDQKIVAEKIIIDDDLTRKDMQFCCEDTIQMIKCENDEDWLQDFALCCWVNGESNFNN